MSDWVEATLGACFALDNSKLGDHVAEPTVLSLSKYDGFVRADDYFDKRIASAKLDAYKPVPLGGWAFSTIHIDEGSIARNNVEPGVISPMYTTMRWIGDRIAIPEYLALLVRQPAMLDEYKSRAQGSINRRRSLPFKTFAEISIALPSLAEQRRIVAVVAAVDAQVEALEHEQAKAHGARLAFELKSCANLESMPAVVLGQIAEVVGGVTKDQKKESADGNVHVPYLRVANVQRGFLDLREVTTIRVPAKMLADRALQVGDLLLNEGGDRDKLGRGWVWEGQIPDCVHQNHVHRARIADQDVYLPKFVSMWANTFGPDWFFNNGGQTNGIASISISKVRQFPVPVIGIDQQREIVAVDDALRGVEDAVGRELSVLRTVRTDLLAAVLSQEITIDTAVDRFVKAA